MEPIYIPIVLQLTVDIGSTKADIKPETFALARQVANRFTKSPSIKPHGNKGKVHIQEKITRTLAMRAQGHTYGEIAEQFGVKDNSVYYYVSQAKKLGLSSADEAEAYFRKAAQEREGTSEKDAA